MPRMLGAGGGIWGKTVSTTVLAVFAVIALGRGPAVAQSGPTGCDPGEKKIRFSHVTTPATPKGEAAVRLATIVNEEFDGRLCMEVYPNSELFNDNEVMAAMQRGEVELAAPDIAKIDTIAPAFQIFSLPFLFRDTTALQWFQNSGAGARLKRSVGDAGFVGLAFWNNGMRQMSATRPLESPEDAKGLTFRVSGSEAQEAAYRSLGAQTKKLAFSKVYDALAAGEVQGQENTWSNILTKKFYEVQDGITETNHNVLLYLLVTSKPFWNSIPSDDRRRLSAIIAQISAEQNRAVEEQARISKLDLESLGVEIRTLTPEARRAWIQTMSPVWDRFRERIDERLLEAAVYSNR